MDAGVPIKAPVAGIAMGLVTSGGKCTRSSPTSRASRTTTATWTSRSAAPEGHHRAPDGHQDPGDHAGDHGEAFAQARDGRLLHPRGDAGRHRARRARSCRRWAPRIETIKIDPEKIGAVIGPGGKMIRAIQSETGTTIEIEDDGTVRIPAPRPRAARRRRR